MLLKIKRLVDDAVIPQCATEGSAGLDLSATETVIIGAGLTSVIPTGLSVQFPIGYVGLVCPRSGLAAKHSVTVGNAPGVIDSDYRGEVKVILINHGKKKFIVTKGDRIAQLLLVPIATSSFQIVETTELSTTERGEGGFGSTGTGVAGPTGSDGTDTPTA
jgi:dUTP pyrophosphatase